MNAKLDACQKRISEMEQGLDTIRSIYENREMSTEMVASEMLRVAIEIRTGRQVQRVEGNNS